MCIHQRRQDSRFGRSRGTMSNDMKLGFWERRRVRKTFERLVSPGVIAAIEKDPTKFIKAAPEIRHFQFVIILLDDERPDDVPAMLNRVVDAIFNHHAMISNIYVSLVVAWFGFPFPDTDSVEERLKLVNTLVTGSKDLLRIAHGQCNGKVGNMGSEKRFAYGAVIPDFNNILKRLLDSPLGTVIEVPEP